MARFDTVNDRGPTCRVGNRDLPPKYSRMSLKQNSTPEHTDNHSRSLTIKMIMKT